MLFPSFERGGLPWFVTGVNYPWIWTYGNDIGPNHFYDPEGPRVAFNQPDRYPEAPTADDIFRDFQTIKAWRVDVVRMWAFENGEGLVWNPQGNRVEGLDSTFIDNVRLIMEAASRARIRIYWTLLTFGDFTDNRALERLIGRLLRAANPPSYRFLLRRSSERVRRAEEEQRESEALRQRIVSTMQNIFSDNTCMNSYIRRVVLPFVEVVQRHRPDALFAIDLMNEADWIWLYTDPEYLRRELARLLRLRIPPLPLELRPLIMRARQTESNVISRLNRMADAIKCHHQNVLVSAGFALYHTVFRNQLLLSHFDFFDFHHYAHYDVRDVSGNLPQLRRRPRIGKPCLIGECGLGGQFQKDFLGLSFERAYSRSFLRAPRVPLGRLFADQATCVDNYLRNAHDRGFAGCMVWEYGRQLRHVFENERRLSDNAGWTDKYPLLWKKSQAARTSSRFCYHAPYELNIPDIQNRLCGRPAVQCIFRFTTDLSQGRLSPGP